jgi:hypothetical protein
VGFGSLAQLQRLLVEAVSNPRPIQADADLSAYAASLLLPSPRGMDPASRLEVYREQFWQRHLASLGDDFPTLIWVLGGSARFRELAVEYLQAHPPRTWNLQRLGADLPAYVAKTKPWASDGLAVDAARLDWAFMEAFDAPDAPPLDLGVLANAAPEAVATARVAFHPAVRRVVTAHPVHELRDAVRSGAPCERPPKGNTHAVVWRDPACFLRSVGVDAMASELMSSLADGTPLGDACAAVAGAHPEAAPEAIASRVGEWFQHWTMHGWVSAVAL